MSYPRTVPAEVKKRAAAMQEGVYIRPTAQDAAQTNANAGADDASEGDVQ